MADQLAASPRRPRGPAPAPADSAVQYGPHTGPRDVRLVGELDRCEVPRLRAVLDRVGRLGHRPVTVELSGLTFLDAAGMRVLADALATSDVRGPGLFLHDPTPWVRRILILGGLDHAVRPGSPDSGPPAADPDRYRRLNAG